MARQNNTQRMQQQNPTPNEVLSKQDMLNRVLRGLKARGREIEEVLPLDVTFENFYSAVNQALRNNPDLLECTPVSIVNACVKAAYDGLRLDGREAALVSHRVKVSPYNTKPDVYETQAQYFPMVFGLVQQILRGGEVLSIEAEVVYENDEWDITRGTDGKIHHRPNMEEDPGAMLFAYTVATLKSGVKTTAYLRKHEIIDVMMASKSGVDKDGNPKGVWKRWPRQMWLKTVLRFHRKTLPLGDRQIVDSEQHDLFPNMQQPTNPLGLTAPAPAMPTRANTVLQDQSGTSEGSALDFGNQGQREEVEQGEQQQNQPEQEKAKVTVAPSSDPIPGDEEEWAAWQREVEQNIAACSTAHEVQNIAAEERERLVAATKERRDWINGVISDRLTDLVSEAGDGSAPVDGDDKQGQE